MGTMRVYVHGQAVVETVEMPPAIVITFQEDKSDEYTVAMYIGTDIWRTPFSLAPNDQRFWYDFCDIFPEDSVQNDYVQYWPGRKPKYDYKYGGNSYRIDYPEYDMQSVEVVIGQIERMFVVNDGEMSRII